MSLPFRNMNSRLQKACQRLGLARHEMRKLARLAENPETLDSELLVYSEKAFQRHLHTFAAETAEGAASHALCMFSLKGENIDLRHAVQILNGGTRGGDIVSRTGRARFTLLLRDCHISGARAVARRLGRALRKSCFPGASGTVEYAVIDLDEAMREGRPLECLTRRLASAEEMIPLS